MAIGFAIFSFILIISVIAKKEGVLKNAGHMKFVQEKKAEETNYALVKKLISQNDINLSKSIRLNSTNIINPTHKVILKSYYKDSRHVKFRQKRSAGNSPSRWKFEPAETFVKDDSGTLLHNTENEQGHYYISESLSNEQTIVPPTSKMPMVPLCNNGTMSNHGELDKPTCVDTIIPLASNPLLPSPNADMHVGQKIADLLGDSLLYEALQNCLITHETCSTNPSFHLIRRHTCLCEQKCKDYGNCCLDYNLGEINSSSRKNKRWSCAKIRHRIGYFVITSCPTDWNNNHVRLQCENETYNQSDSFRSIPVSSKDTLITYRNVYCAICNGDLNSNFWSADLHCPDKAGESVKSVNLEDFKDCLTTFSIPSFANKNNSKNSNVINVLPLIKCDMDLVSDCPEDWTNDNSTEYANDILTKCALIYAPVSKTNFDGIVKYKNKFCAMCNRVSGANFLCPVMRSNPIPPGQPALSLLLDMDFTQGGTIVGSQERCPEMHLYDPWSRKCRNVMCGCQYQYQDGECIPKMDFDSDSKEFSSIHLKFNSSLLSNCLRVKLVAEEVSILENGTVVIVSDGAHLNPGQYEHTDNSTISVCVSPSIMDKQYVATFSNVQGHLTIVGICISLLSLLIKIILSFFMNEAGKLPPKIVLYLSISLFIAQSIFLFGITRTENYILCACMGIFMHYCFLSTFFWMNVLAYDIWKTFASSKSMLKTKFENSQLLRYRLYGWLTPLAIVVVAIFANWVFHYPSLNPRYGKAVCWISNKIALAVFFGAPSSVLVLSNVVFFVITAFEIRKTTIAAKFAFENARKGKDRVQFGLYCKLAFIMGLTWLFGFVAAFAGSMVLWYFFIVFNSIQGVYVLVAFTHFRLPPCLKPKKLLYTTSGNSILSRTSVTLSTSVSKV